MFKKILIANRGEIAMRIIRACRELSIRTVAVHSQADEGALHVRFADEAICIGRAPAAESYLNVPAIISAAEISAADAIHPGYGFLSENAAFAQVVERCGLTFIGPRPEVMARWGDKISARELAAQFDLPLLPGSQSLESVSHAESETRRIGYPVMLKARGGGGGRGMRVVRRLEELRGAFESATAEALAGFKNAELYLERYVERPRHVEFQALADEHGQVWTLGERECSLQRRHQKVVEETPCPAIDDETVRKMGELAVKGAQAVGYFSAGTFEFLLAEDQSFYFLEMNTRLQVEHPITELVTGIDLVREMVRIANGEALGYGQSDVVRRGAAIECRIYAEDPATGFLPSPGVIHTLRTPSGPGVRDDGGAYAGCTISSYYDPLVSKLSTWAPTRALALARMRRALGEYVVGGIRTNLAFHERLMTHPEFAAGRYDTGFIDRHKDELLSAASGHEPSKEQLASALAALAYHRAVSSQPAAPAANGHALAPWVHAHRARLGRASRGGA